MNKIKNSVDCKNIYYQLGHFIVIWVVVYLVLRSMTPKRKKTSKHLYAAVRFFVDEQRKVYYVPVEHIKNVIEQKNYVKSYYIRRGVDEFNEFIYEAGQILAVSDDLDELKAEKKKRFVFNKKRLSDAVAELANENKEVSEEEHVTAEEGHSQDSHISKKFKKSKKKIKNDEVDDKEKDVEDKLNVLESQQLNFHEAESESKTTEVLKDEILKLRQELQIYKNLKTTDATTSTAIVNQCAERSNSLDGSNLKQVHLLESPKNQQVKNSPGIENKESSHSKLKELIASSQPSTSHHNTSSI